MADQVEVELVRAYWTGEDARRNEGEIISLDVEKAMRLIESGVAKTVLKAPAPAPLPAKSKGA